MKLYLIIVDVQGKKDVAPLRSACLGPCVGICNCPQKIWLDSTFIYLSCQSVWHTWPAHLDFREFYKYWCPGAFCIKLYVFKTVSLFRGRRRLSFLLQTALPPLKRHFMSLEGQTCSLSPLREFSLFLKATKWYLEVVDCACSLTTDFHCRRWNPLGNV